MQNVIIDQPYEFVPPVYGKFWPWLMQFYLKRYLRKAFAVQSVENRDVHLLQESLDAGHSLLIAPNHCRLSDPLTLGYVSRVIKREMHAMASWHLFKQEPLKRFVLRRMGAFSVYREGIDRKAIDTAVNILVEGKRPLVVFAEGAISRHNDVLMPLMDGTSFIARTAAKRREKLGTRGGVVVHPVAIRYFFKGDVVKTVEPVLEEIESHFSWYPQQGKTLTRRLQQIGQALLSLKEIEYFGHARAGDFYERVDSLMEDVLAKLEKEWQIKDVGESIVSRVKVLRSAILPDMVKNNISPDERRRRWKQLAACYYVQQMSHYPRNYVRNSEKNIPEHILETVERFEEDFTDHVRVHGPLNAVVQVGQAIPVASQRDRSQTEDPIMVGIRTQLTDMLTKLSAESVKI
ncbi:lysophospholipid acyltransferase family protein [Bythopirellula polymerisocia]|uniref:Acyltransferase n=1 Tax=Bythopirellula polymerisocia TaxID=2528003 RepID=A0A5C6CJK3_9BACT|nr:lysophospholipid acyltransferase family protein [Bythopirellula polymerisocia]TWU24628.1 Acyltransferase [Bythopirellula polymerisocia]